jgi:hypothetical protein
VAESEGEKLVSFDPRIVLRPRSLDEVLDLTFAYLRIHFRDFRPLFVVQLVLALVLVAGLRVGLEQSWAMVWAVAVVLAPLTEKVVLVFGGDHLFGNTSSWRSSVMRVLRRIAPLTVAAVLVPLPILPALLSGFDDETTLGLAVMVSLFWPIVLAWFLFFGVTLLLENLSLAATFRRSSLLIKFRLGRAITFVVVAFHIRLFIVLTVELLTQFVISFVLQLGSPIDALLNHGGSYPSVIAFFLAAPVVSLARMFDYVDTRTRLEGWDLQVRFRALLTKRDAPRPGVAA